MTHFGRVFRHQAGYPFVAALRSAQGPGRTLHFPPLGMAVSRGGTAMEFLVVRFPGSRRVLIDDEFNGRTNELIELEAGTYTVSLEPPANFTPESRRIVLRNTSPLEPSEVTFDEA